MSATNNSGPTKAMVTEQEALDFHAQGRPGKLEITPTKPMATQRDLSLAYSPGVAVPVKAIAADPGTAYDYTTRGNMVAVISNGTAILGLGNLGALASKPVMEGKSVLFKRFADVDSIDLEVDTENVDEFINCVRYLGPSFGGINLEDIKAPDCFIIEQKLREIMDIPVFHDDQHGTAIIAAAGLINALDLTGRDFANTKLVCNGAGAAAIACIELIKAMGFNPANITLCDTKGVIYQGREEGMNQWKSAHAVKTDRRTLAEAMEGADVVFGLSQKGAFTQEMIRSMAPRPIIFAMANPDPEITPEEVARIRDDAIMATGRSDYPNQVNNVLGFPYIFRGALDVRATTINDAMKIAAVRALASLAREDVPDDVAAAYQGMRPRFGPQYIIPVPFDPRLISAIPVAVARAAMETGVARKEIADFSAYSRELSARRDPIASTLQRLYEGVRRHPKRVVFAEGEEELVMRAAISYANQELGTAILLGRDDAHCFERLRMRAKRLRINVAEPIGPATVMRHHFINHFNHSVHLLRTGGAPRRIRRWKHATSSPGIRRPRSGHSDPEQCAKSPMTAWKGPPWRPPGRPRQGWRRGPRGLGSARRSAKRADCDRPCPPTGKTHRERPERDRLSHQNPTTANTPRPGLQRPARALHCRTQERTDATSC